MPIFEEGYILETSDSGTKRKSSKILRQKLLDSQCRVNVGLSSFSNFNFNLFPHINILLHYPKAVFVAPVSRHSEDCLPGLEGHRTFRLCTRNH